MNKRTLTKQNSTMEKISKQLILTVIFGMTLLVSSCDNKPKLSEAIGDYIVTDRKTEEDIDFDITLNVSHLELDKYQFKRWYGEKLVYDDIYVVKDSLVYDASGTFKMGSFSKDFSSFKKGRLTFSRTSKTAKK